MGVKLKSPRFVREDVLNRDLMLKMLKAEDALYFAPEGQAHLMYHGGITSLEGIKVIQREILNQFGFDTDDESVKNYRTVIDEYYKSPIEYDSEIMNSVVYLRENRLLYYTLPNPQVGDIISDVPLQTISNTPTSLINILKSIIKPYTILAAFSMS